MTSIHFALDRGERQLWAGVPRQGVVLRGADAFLIPFSVLWAGFAVVWEVSVVRSDAPLFFALWGVPFVIAGAYITVGRFWIDARRRARTMYAVTSERIIITSGLIARSSQSLSLRTLSDLTLQERSDGTGTITFGAMPPWAGLFAGASWPGAPQIPSFEQVPDARRLYGLIRDAQRASTSSAVCTSSAV